VTIKTLIRTVAHYPHQGIMFRDITTLLKDPIGLRSTVDQIVKRYKGMKIDKVAGIESRGFIVGAPVAYLLGVGLVPIRKKGKLPAETIGHDYQLEYGADRIEIHTDAIAPGEKVLLVDVGKMGAEVIECCFIVDLPDVGGRKRLEKLGLKVFALCEFEGE
jgi:adenine phosphoribosyltransferase